MGGYYLREFSFKSHGSLRMVGQLYDSAELFLLSINPHGFYIRYGSGLSLQGVQETLPPFIFTDNEISFLDLMYQIGAIGMFLFLAYLYFPLFSSKKGWIFSNDYKILLFMSTAGLLHTFNINNIFIYIYVIYLTLQSGYQRKFLFAPSGKLKRINSKISGNQQS